MIGWGEILSTEQIQQLVAYIRTLKPPAQGRLPPLALTPTRGAVSFSADVAPIFKAKCAACHGKMGGWDSSTYEAVMISGDHAPVVIAGDVENSLRWRKN